MFLETEIASLHNIGSLRFQCLSILQINNNKTIFKEYCLMKINDDTLKEQKIAII